jgi:hypothetical protein
MTTGTAATAFAITVPETWFEIELRPTVREESTRSMVYERVKDQPELREHRATIVRVLLEFSERAWNSGARYCACMVEPTTDGPITTSVTVTIIDAPPNTSGEQDTHRVDAVLDAFAPTGSVAPKDAPSLTVATLPKVGETARMYGKETVDVGEGHRIESVFMRTFVPIPNSTQLALISAASPVLWLEEELLDLFDAVTGTFQFV